MLRTVDDADYLECISTLHRKNYFDWRERILPQMDSLVADLETMPIDEVMQKYRLTPRDVALLIRLHYLSAEEVEKFGLEWIDRAIPE